jgi:hypothetical protein
VSGCPARLALCGVPCGCDGDNPSHRPWPRAEARADPFTHTDMLELHLRLSLDGKDDPS